MQVLKKFGIVGGVLAAAAVSITLAVPAGADTAAQPGDVVGVGSDTVQNAADFVFDGTPGVSGAYNTLGNVNRVDNVFATGDANGRTTYDGTCGAVDGSGLASLCPSGTSGPNALGASVILRSGEQPVVRPNGSGGGIGALISDSSGGGGYDKQPTGAIQYARASRLPTPAEITNCTNTTGCGSLHVYQFATDNLGIARVSSGFNGPAGLSADTLYKIFVDCSITKWSQVPGYTGSAGNDTIYPITPPPTSGTGTYFYGDLAQAENLNSTPNPGTCTHQAQEHDPTGIYASPNPADSIEPFSAGKLALINSGYYVNGINYAGKITNSATPNGPYTKNYLTLESGAATGQTGDNFTDTRGLYFVVRQTDVNSTTPFQPGGSLNFVQTLFSDSQSAIRSTTGRTLIAQAGFTPAFKDCQTNPTSC